MSTSRTGRLAKLGTMVGGQAARHAATRTANLVRSDERSREALRARNAELADRLVTVLGTMRGASMKFGQMLSMMDAGLVPDDQRAEFQRKLAALQDNAPDVPWRKMRTEIEHGLDASLGEAFAEFDEQPVAAASIGQVYRAQLKDGRRVAVKVQYPGIERAVRADLKNIALFLNGVARFMSDSLDPKQLAAELHERVMEELDYELEAANTRSVARTYRGHPFIRVPEVIESVSSQRVLVTEWLQGRPLASAAHAPLAERNRVAEILFRFYVGTAYRMGMYSGDPHPGNSLLLDDGRVGFLDFGLFKRIGPAVAEAELAGMRAGAAGDAAGVADALKRMGFISDRSAVPAEELLTWYTMVFGWYLRDEEIEIGPEVANDILAGLIHPALETSATLRKQNVPGDHAFRGRADLHLVAILGQLHPRLNFHRIAREWIFGDEPVTELGTIQRAWDRGEKRLDYPTYRAMRAS